MPGARTVVASAASTTTNRACSPSSWRLHDPVRLRRAHVPGVSLVLGVVVPKQLDDRGHLVATRPADEMVAHVTVHPSIVSVSETSSAALWANMDSITSPAASSSVSAASAQWWKSRLVRMA